jgi:hypothetical protein
MRRGLAIIDTFEIATLSPDKEKLLRRTVKFPRKIEF